MNNHTTPISYTQTPEGNSFQIQAQHDFSVLRIKVGSSKKVFVEASAMAAMDSHLQMKTKMRGGLTRLVTRESLFINEFEAKNLPAEIYIAPGTPGDICSYHIEPGKKLYLTGSCFLACESGVNLNTKWQGFAKGLFSGESFFLIECTGQGTVWFNSFGAIIPMKSTDNIVVDTGHIVAFTENVQYNLTKFGGYKSFFFSGEGIVAKFSGEGQVWIQSKKPSALVAWAHQFRKHS